MTDKLNLFIPITKVDAEKRLVYGIATAEQEDRSGEICDYASTKPFYEKWSAAASEVTDGKSLGNVRAMHGSIAAGKLTEIAFNDDDKQIEVCAKVVDDGEWLKVIEGVYTGFSQGGDYIKRWKDADDGKIHYTADPVEISLVDLPCLPSATFSIVKAHGVTETRHFKPQGAATMNKNDQIAARAAELAKAAGQPEAAWANFIEQAGRDIEAALAPPAPVAEPATTAAVVEKTAEPAPAPVVVAAPAAPEAPAAPVAEPVAVAAVVEKAAAEAPEWEQVWRTRDGQTFKNKAEARTHAEVLKNATPFEKAAAALGAALSGATAPVAITGADALAKALAGFAALGKAHFVARRAIIKAALDLGTAEALPPEIYVAGPKPEAEALAKSVSLYSLSNLLQLLACIEDAEESMEYDSYWGGVNVTDELKTRFGALLIEFGNIIAEGLDAVLAAMSDEESTEALARAAGPVSLVKAGARHSKKDQGLLQTAHDALQKMGAECGDAEKGAGAGALAKGGDLAKQVNDLTATVKAQAESMGKAAELMTAATNKMGVLEKRIGELEAQPAGGGAPGTGASRAGVTLNILPDSGVPAGVDANLTKAHEALGRGDMNAVAEELIKASFTRPMQATEGQLAPPRMQRSPLSTIAPEGGPGAPRPAEPAPAVAAA